MYTCQLRSLHQLPALVHIGSGVDAGPIPRNGECVAHTPCGRRDWVEHSEHRAAWRECEDDILKADGDIRLVVELLMDTCTRRGKGHDGVVELKGERAGAL